MDAQQFDALTKALGSGASRRRVLGALAGSLVAALGRQGATVANHKPEHCAKAGQKPRRGKSGKGCCAGLTEGADGRCRGVGSPDPCQGCSGRCCTGSSGRAWCCSPNDSCCGDGVAQALCCIANQRCCTGAFGAQCCDPNETCCSGQCCNPRQTCDSEFGCIDSD